MTDIDSSDKDAYTEAVIAEELRTKITGWADGAVKHGGVDRDWANSWLRKLGAEQITGYSEYRMNVPLTGFYGWRCKASSRAEAAERFLAQVKRITKAGKITADHSNDSVYDVAFVDDPVTVHDVHFYAGPEDPTESTDPVPGLDGLKVGIRAMLMEGVAEQGWNYQYAVQAVSSMDLPPLPDFGYRTVEVPVSGIHKTQIRAFADADDEAVQRVVASHLKRQGSALYVAVDEMGTPAQVDDEPESDDPF